MLAKNAQELATKAPSVEQKTFTEKTVKAKNSTLVHDGAKRQRNRKRKVRNHGKLIQVTKVHVMKPVMVMVPIPRMTQVIVRELEHKKCMSSGK